jgi:outer membrane protein assembly factor BamD
MNKNFILNIILIYFLTSCSHNKEKQETAELIYNQAITYFEEGQLYSAREKFQYLESNFPYSDLVVKGEIYSAFISYSIKEYDQTITLCDKFIKLHPVNQYVSYIYYLKAISLYQQINDKYRDQSTSHKAIKSLKELIARFPNSEFEIDAGEKLLLLNNRIAASINNIGKFYLFKEQYLPSMIYYLEVINKYPNSRHKAEALYRISEAFAAIGITHQAQKYGNDLIKNHPQNIWTERYSKLEEKFLKE